MIVRKYRPYYFRDIVGQDESVKVVQAIVRKLRAGEDVVRTLIFEGSYGTGKTTLSRVVGRALQCKNYKGNDVCGECSACKSDINKSGLYEEYDAGAVGNVDDIRVVMEGAYYIPEGEIKVINIDEVHLCSRAAQGNLLKFLEELPRQVLVILCTTDVQSLLNTIVSRSLVLSFNVAGYDESCSYMESVLGDEIYNKLTDDMKLELHRRSGGHLRDLGMLLERLLLVGSEIFKSGELEAVYDYMYAIYRKDRVRLFKAVDGMLGYSISSMRREVYYIASDLFINIFSNECKFMDRYGIKDKAVMLDWVSKYIININSDWFINGFGGKEQFRTALLALFYIMAK